MPFNMCPGPNSSGPGLIPIRLFEPSAVPLCIGAGAHAAREEVQALVYASMAGDARVVNDVTIPDNFRLLHARE